MKELTSSLFLLHLPTQAPSYFLARSSQLKSSAPFGFPEESAIGLLYLLVLDGAEQHPEGLWVARQMPLGLIGTGRLDFVLCYTFAPRH